MKYQSIKEIEESKEKPKMSVFDFIGSREKVLLVIGLIVSLLNGGLMPLFGYFLAKVLSVLNKFEYFSDPDYDTSQLDYDKDDLVNDNDKYVLAFVGLAVASFLLSFF